MNNSTNNTTERKSVLILDIKVIDSPQAGIGVARCFKNLGYNVYGADNTPFVTTSDLFIKTFVLEEIQNLNLDSLVRKFKNLKETYGINLIVPCYDETSILLAFIKDKLDFLGIQIIAPSLECMRMFRKSNLPNLVIDTDFKTPPTKVIDSIEEGLGFVGQIGYPVFAKGLTKDAMIANNPVELESAIKHISKLWNNSEIKCIVQKGIIGKFVNVLITYKSNKIIAYTEMEKVGVDSHGATWFGKITTDTNLLKATEVLCQKIGLNDCIIELETIREENGDYYLYEINPRTPAWLYASSLNGLNFISEYLENTDLGLKLTQQETYFGRETKEFLATSMEIAKYGNLTMFSKGAAYKNDNTKYPSEVIL